MNWEFSHKVLDGFEYYDTQDAEEAVEFKEYRIWIYSRISLSQQYFRDEHTTRYKKAIQQVDNTTHYKIRQNITRSNTSTAMHKTHRIFFLISSQ